MNTARIYNQFYQINQHQNRHEDLRQIRQQDRRQIRHQDRRKICRQTCH